MPTATTETQADTKQLIDQIIERHRYEEHSLIGVLQDAQKELNWLPQDCLKQIAQKLDVPLSRVYAIATFYKAFSLKPRGKYLIHSCQGTACHVRGGNRLLEKLERDLGIKTGYTTSDLRFTLEKVRCVGCCSLAPVVVINKETYGRLTPTKVTNIIKKYKTEGAT